MMSAACALPASTEQPVPSDPGQWTIEYAVSGGIAFNVHYVRVARDGALTAGDRRLGMEVAGRAPDDLMTRLTAFLKTAPDARKTAPMPDAIGTSIVVTSAGRKRELEPAPEIAAAMESAWSDAVTRAIAGSWTQSGWRLCNPAAQLTADETDTPIDDLTFRDDGTFDVTWPGGGARPTYRGRYTLNPRFGMIQVSAAPATTPPRDFAGDGSFQIAQRQLTLKRVWLGTRKAPRRPDICELTFTRK